MERVYCRLTKVMAFLLVLAMIMGLTPVSAYAAGGQGTIRLQTSAEMASEEAFEGDNEAGFEANAFGDDEDEIVLKEAAEPETEKETEKETQKETETETETETEAPAPKPQPQPVKTATTVTNLKMEITRKASASNPKNTITVSPAYGREVRLEYYDRASRTWKVAHTYKTANKKKAWVTLAYTDYWRKASYTYWRVVIPASDKGKAFKSKYIRLIPINRKSLSLNAKTAVIINAQTGRVLYNFNKDKKRAQASMTKIMTALLAIENNPLKKKVRISQHVENTPWTYIPLETGDKVYLEDLLYAALLPSSNGSAVALAEATAGSETAFAGMMTRKARSIGAVNTAYKNAHGLDASGHYSTAYDTALILKEAWQYPAFRTIVGTRSYSFNTLRYDNYCGVSTSNALLGRSGMLGGKTGTTGDAGYCFAGVYQYKGKSYITVVMGCDYESARWNDTLTLQNYIRKYGW